MTEQTSEVLLNNCPHCGTETLPGFGLAGGGYGAYVYCPSEICFLGYFAKLQWDDED
jgi:hypothetical protein